VSVSVPVSVGRKSNEPLFLLCCYAVVAGRRRRAPSKQPPRNRREQRESLAKQWDLEGSCLQLLCGVVVDGWFRPLGRRRCKQRPSNHWVKLDAPERAPTDTDTGTGTDHSPLLLQRCLRCREARYRHPERTAAHVREPDAMAEFHTFRVSPMLTADP
jgi:hypothetical protein